MSKRKRRVQMQRAPGGRWPLVKLPDNAVFRLRELPAWFEPVVAYAQELRQAANAPMDATYAVYMAMLELAPPEYIPTPESDNPAAVYVTLAAAHVIQNELRQANPALTEMELIHLSHDLVDQELRRAGGDT